MKTAEGLPCPSEMTSPVRASDEVDLYTPGVRVCPVMSGGLVASGARPAASLQAVVRSDWACAATASVAWTEPCSVRDWEPVIALPESRPAYPFFRLLI